MADDKKPEAKPADSFFAHPDPFVEIVWTVIVLLLLAYVANALLSNIFAFLSGDLSLGGIFESLKNFVLGLLYGILHFKFFFWILYIILGICIWNLFTKINALRAIEHKLLYPEIPTEEKAMVNPHWERILSHIESLNENDWRLAIIEADIMLADMLDKMSLPGESIGDKLKAVEKSDFTTIDNAWEAHKIRNQIAHEGPSFMLNQREAKRVIGLYESVFREFQMI